MRLREVQAIEQEESSGKMSINQKVGLALTWLGLSLLMLLAFHMILPQVQTPNTVQNVEYTVCPAPPPLYSTESSSAFDNCVNKLQAQYEQSLAANQSIATVWFVLFEVLLTAIFVLCIVYLPRLMKLPWFNSENVTTPALIIFGTLGVSLIIIDLARGTHFLFGCGWLFAFLFIVVLIVRPRPEKVKVTQGVPSEVQEISDSVDALERGIELGRQGKYKESHHG